MDAGAGSLTRGPSARIVLLAAGVLSTAACGSPGGERPAERASADAPAGDTVPVVGGGCVYRRVPGVAVVGDVRGAWARVTFTPDPGHGAGFGFDDEVRAETPEGRLETGDRRRAEAELISRGTCNPVGDLDLLGPASGDAEGTGGDGRGHGGRERPAGRGLPGDRGGGVAEDEPDDLLFTASHVNFAWGFRAEGCAVRRDGGVVSWLPEPDSPDTVTATGGGHPGARLGEIPGDSVAAMAALVPEAARGGVEASDGGMRDFGSVTYRGRYRRPGAAAWREVVLLEAGDWKRVNRSEASRTLVGWLSRALEPFDCPDPTSLSP